MGTLVERAKAKYRITINLDEDAFKTPLRIGTENNGSLASVLYSDTLSTIPP